MTPDRLQKPLRALSGLFALFFLLQLLFVDGAVLPGILNRPWTGLFLLCLSLAGLFALERPYTAPALFFLTAAVYLSSFRWHGSDDLPTALLPFCLLEHGTLTLDPYAPWFAGYQHTAVVKAHGHLASFYPLPGAFLALPLYVLPALRGVEPTDAIVHQLSKCAASLITAAAVVMMFLVYRRKTAPRRAFGLALVYALGTSLFSTCSQGLWQHGASCLALGAALWALDRSSWTLLGALAALSVAARTTNAFFALAFLAAAFWKSGLRGFFRFAAGAALPAGLTLLYWNTHLLGLPADIGFNASMMHVPPTRDALLGFWVSPARGLLFYSPVAFIALWGAAREIRAGDRATAVFLTAAAGAGYLLFSCFDVWHAAFSFGPRYLTESVAVLFFFLPAGAEAASRTGSGRKAFLGAVVLSILVHSIGVYWRWRWEQVPWDTVWTWKRHPLAFVLTGGKI